jgi:hypothetical protein
MLALNLALIEGARRTASARFGFSGTKLALTEPVVVELAALTVQVTVRPAQPLFQPAKREPDAGTALTVISESGGISERHAVPLTPHFTFWRGGPLLSPRLEDTVTMLPFPSTLASRLVSTGGGSAGGSGVGSI